MNPTKIIVKDAEGREVNTSFDRIGKYPPLDSDNAKWNDFEQSVKTYRAPNIPDGENECELVWQMKLNDDWVLSIAPTASPGDRYRQVWVLAPPEPVTEKQGIETVEEAAKNYVKNNTDDYEGYYGFIAGAEWQAGQRPLNGWVPVSERLPNMGDYVLICEFEIPNFVRSVEYGKYVYYFTHWTPLPLPPKP